MRDFFAALLRHAAAMPERVALVGPDATLTWRALADAVLCRASAAESLPNRVGLLCSKSAEGVIAELALAFAGKEIVPLPEFFSAAQIAHITGATQLGCVVADRAALTRGAVSVAAALVLEPQPFALCAPRDGSGRIIFTSGSTGTPKGVRLGVRQIAASAAALIAAIGAGAEDSYLSVLPQSLLLEQIAGIYAPLLVGATVHLAAGPVAALAETAARVRPTVTVLVPELLALWVRTLEQAHQRAPASLRFVAVGGAPVAPALAERARALGVPVQEGYGLSECGSVVALNRPGERRAGTVGRPLHGVEVRIEDGEIVVSGPTVMDGYVASDDAPRSWRTGDLGRIDAAGRLTVLGRKDSVLVTAAGRNVSPEWIEAMIAADPDIAHALLGLRDGTLVVVVSPARGRTLPELGDRLAALCAGAPAYARPVSWLLLEEEALRAHALLTPNFRPRRAALAALLAAPRLPAPLHPVARYDVAV